MDLKDLEDIEMPKVDVKKFKENLRTELLNIPMKESIPYKFYLTTAVATLLFLFNIFLIVKPNVANKINHLIASEEQVIQEKNNLVENRKVEVKKEAFVNALRDNDNEEDLIRFFQDLDKKNKTKNTERIALENFRLSNGKKVNILPRFEKKKSFERVSNEFR